MLLNFSWFLQKKILIFKVRNSYGGLPKMGDLVDKGSVVVSMQVSVDPQFFFPKFIMVSKSLLEVNLSLGFLR